MRKRGGRISRGERESIESFWEKEDRDIELYEKQWGLEPVPPVVFPEQAGSPQKEENQDSKKEEGQPEQGQTD